MNINLALFIQVVDQSRPCFDQIDGLLIVVEVDSHPGNLFPLVLFLLEFEHVLKWNGIQKKMKRMGCNDRTKCKMLIFKDLENSIIYRELL